MKKISLFFVVLFVFVSVQLKAQKFGIEIGSVNPMQVGSTFSTNYFHGARFGATVNYELKNNFSLLSGVLYSVVYSDKVQNYTSTDSVMYSTFNHSVDIPLRISYTLPITKDLKVFAFGGPNLNIGIAQPQTINAVLSATVDDVLNEITGQKITSGTTDLYKNALINRINFQMGAGGGVQWKNYQLKAGYDFGINSINKVDSSRLLHQGGWYISLVYQF